MSSLKMFIIGLSMLVGTLSAYAQTSPLTKIYHVKNEDGSVSLLAENHGCVPYTVNLSCNLVNMRSSVELPARLAVRPIQSAALLAVLTPINPLSSYSYRYTCPAQWGICSGPDIGTEYQYKLPFKPGTKWNWGLFDPVSGSLKFAGGSYYFALPPASPICAIREGLVADVVHNYNKNTRKHCNYVIIYHDDGSYAEYLNLQQYSTTVAIGQRVAQGQEIALSSTETTPSSLQVDVMRPGLLKPEPVAFTFLMTLKPIANPK